MKHSGARPAAVFALLILLAASSAEAETLAVFTKSSGNPVARGTRAGAAAMAKVHGASIVHFIPTSADNVGEQAGLVEEAIKSKPEAIVLAPVDVAAMVPSAQKINAAAIPLVNVGDRLTGGDALAFVGTDDYGIARDTARTLFKAMGGKGNVVVLEGPENIPSALGRLRGFRDALKEFPDVKVVLSRSALYTRPAASDLLKSLLRSSPAPQIDGVLAANDAMAFGAIEAFRQAKQKAPPVVGINAGKEAIDLIKSGEMLASGDFSGFVEGCLGVEIAVRALKNSPVPKEVMVRTEVVDKTNYQTYEVPLDQRRCPTLESMTVK